MKRNGLISVVTLVVISGITALTASGCHSSSTAKPAVGAEQVAQPTGSPADYINNNPNVSPTAKAALIAQAQQRQQQR